MLSDTRKPANESSVALRGFVCTDETNRSTMDHGEGPLVSVPADIGPDLLLC